MRVGGMRHIVTKYTKVSARDEYGQLVETWQNEGSFKAQVTKVGGSKALNNSQVFDNSLLKIQTWNHYGIKETNRLEWRGDMYQIENIEPSYDDRTQVLNVSKIKN